MSVAGSPGRAPDVVLPSIGGGGMDCPTVGFGAGGSGLGGGGGFGPSWISSDCNNRKLFEVLWSSGHQAEALTLLKREFPQVREAFEHTAVVPQALPAWCGTLSRQEQQRHYRECYTQ